MATYDFDKLKSSDPKIKYGYSKQLVLESEENPQSLYPYFDFFVEMMNNPNTILGWNAIDIIGNLSAVDKDNKISDVANILINKLHGGNLITCNHAISALAVIAHNKSDIKAQIIDELLKVADDNFTDSGHDSTECKQIAIGKVIDTLGTMPDSIKNNQKVMPFLKNALESDRLSTVKKAEKLIKKLEK